MNKFLKIILIGIFIFGIFSFMSIIVVFHVFDFDLKLSATVECNKVMNREQDFSKYLKWLAFEDEDIDYLFSVCNGQPNRVVLIEEINIEMGINE